MSIVKNLYKKLGSFELKIAHWEIPDSGISALLGPSGSGKSTLFRVLLGLEECSGYSWILNGKEMAQISVPEKRLGVVFQSYELFPHMTALENIQFAGRARKRPRQEILEMSKTLVERLGLQDCVSRRAQFLSGGEKQRVALARALIGKPQMLFLDEPFSALDVHLRKNARALVRDVVGDFKIPTVLVTHDAADVEDLAQQVFKIEKGAIL